MYFRAGKVSSMDAKTKEPSPRLTRVLLRRGLHPADLYSHYGPAAGAGGGYDGQPYGAEPVTEQKNK